MQQSAGAVVLVLEDVDVVELDDVLEVLDVVGVGTVVLDVLEVLDVVGVGTVVLVVEEVDVLLVDDVELLEVVGVGDVVDVVVGGSVVDVVPPPTQAPGAGASSRFRSVSGVSLVVPPNRAQ